MKFFMHIAAVVGALMLATTAEAQGGSDRDDDIPKSFRPPAGMCRIWITGVPANKQPAPTDCATAIRNRPANGRVVFGDRRAKPDYEAPQSPREEERERPPRATPAREPESRPVVPASSQRRSQASEQRRERRPDSSAQRRERRAREDERKERRPRDPS